MRTIRHYSAWAVAILLMTVGVLAMTLISIESRISYGKYRIKQRIKDYFAPKGKHRRTPITQD